MRTALVLIVGMICLLPEAHADLEGVIPSGQGSDWAPLYFNTDGDAGDDLGDAVAMSGDWFLIGEPGADGATTNSGTAWALTWNETSLAYVNAVDLGALVPVTDLTAGSGFGQAVDVDGSYAIVGAPSCSLEGSNAGRAYLFEHDGVSWSHIFTFADGTDSSQFGYSVDITGTHIAIGEPGENSNTGYLNLYEITTAAHETVVVARGGIEPRRAIGDRWSEAVDRDGDLLVIGAPGNDGYAAIYEQIGDGSYVFDSYLMPPSDLDDSNARFGAAVAIDNTTAVVGAPWPEAGSEDHGGVVVFEQNRDTSWSVAARLDDDLTGSNSRFGESLDIHDDLIIVGIPGDNPAGNGSGSAKIFRYAPTSDFWSLEHNLFGLDVQAGDRYADDVAVGPHGVGVGVLRYNTPYGINTGAAFTYRQMSWDDDNWQHDIRTVRTCLTARQLVENPTDNGDMASFGRDVAHDNNIAIIGDPYAENDMGVPEGSVTFLTRASADDDWIALSSKDVALPTRGEYEYFGKAVAIDGDLAIIGAPGYAADLGRAIIMQKSGSSWLMADTLVDDDANAQFGTDVAVATAFGQTYFMVGAPGLYNQAGTVQVFKWNDVSDQADLILTITDPQWSGTTTSRFGEAVDLNVTAANALRLAIGNPWQADSSGYGSISLYEANELGGFWVYGNYTNLIPYSDIASLTGNYCASNIDLDGSFLIAGMPLSDGLKYQCGGAVIYKGEDLTGDGILNWSFSTVLGSSDPGNSDYAGYDVAIDESSAVAVIGVPGMDYADTNAGAVLPFFFDGFDWRNDMTLISNLPLVEMSAGTSVDLDGMSLIAGAPGFNVSDTPLHVPHVLDWELIQATAYQDFESGSMGSDNAWTGGTGGIGRAIFSLWLADPYTVPFDIAQWTGSIQVELDQITFGLMNETRSVTESVNIAGVTEVKSASVTLESGTLQVQENMSIGLPDGYGQLNIGNQGSLEVINFLNLTEDSGTSFTIDGSTGAKITTSVQAPVINGSMRVELGTGINPEDLVEGTRIVLISSGVTPTSVDVAALVLPGLENGLAFQVSYGDPSSRSNGGACGVGEIEDCFGNCCPANWIGDGFCDDGSFSYNGADIYLNCESLGCDGGDCSSCWDDEGEWEMAIEVVSLAGLLDFGDPNSVLVEGEPTALEVVDLTDDGAEEICVTFAGTPGQLYIFENDGAGGIAQQVVLNTGDQPVDITSGDFDDDGRTDLAVANNLGQSVDIYYNDDNDVTNGFVLLTPSLDVGAPPTCLAGINMNLDDVDDLVVGLEDTDGDGNGYWAIYLGTAALRGAGMNNGGGADTSGTPLGVDPSEEEDQKDFVFVGRNSDGKTDVAKRTGATTGFGLTIDEYIVGADPGGIALGDYDGDGLTDIAVTSTVNGTVAILLQEPAGTGDFLNPSQIPLGDEPSGITSVDFDQDGNLDLAIIVMEESFFGLVEPVVRVLQNDGSLTFASIDVAEGEDVVLVDSGDISGSGVAELVTIGDGNSFMRSGTSPIVSLRELESSADCIGDADANGVVDVEDLLVVLGEFNTCTTSCNGDFDDDGDVDISDLLEVIGNWGTCGKD